MKFFCLLLLILIFCLCFLRRPKAGFFNFLVTFIVMVSKLSTATLRWMEYLHRNSSLHSSSGYNVSLKCGKNCFETTRLYNKSGVILRQLTMGKTYTANVQGLTKTGDLIVGATKFYSPGKVK